VLALLLASSFGLMISVSLPPSHILFADGCLLVKQKNKGGASLIRMDLLGYGLTWSAFPNDFHGLRARPNVPSRELQGSLSQVQVFLIRVLVLALCAFLSTPCVGVEFFPPQGTIHAAMHGD
jgi:hypothetical protein